MSEIEALTGPFDSLGSSGAAARLALERGETEEARRLLEAALAAGASAARDDAWKQIRDVSAWPDRWLVAAVRRDPPDAAALETLAHRYWKPLFGRCRLLTQNAEKAGDLAQEAWCRVLRARRALKPDGNFPAYLTAVATNLWRDWGRSARRAGPMADRRLASLDAALPSDEGEEGSLADRLPDPDALEAEEQRELALEIDAALERMAPQSREVLVARFIDGESCAAIGRRHGRTEQTISAWVRRASQELKQHLEASNRAAAPRVEKQPRREKSRA